MLGDKGMRGVVEQLKQLDRFVQDRCSIPPGEGGSKKSGDFDVGSFTEPMWNRDGIPGNEGGIVVLPDFLVQESMQFFLVHPSRSLGPDLL